MSEPSEAIGGFSPKNAMAELVNGSTEARGRKLPFYEQCAAFYALYNKTAHPIVAQTFGVSLATISKLGGCLQRDPRPYRFETVAEKVPVAIRNAAGKIIGRTQQATGDMIEKATNRDMNKGRSPNRIWRYRAVAEEFERLGEDAFAEQYYTAEIHQRLMKVKYDLDGEATARARRGPNPAANDSEGFWYLPPENDSPAETFEVIWLDDGWTWSHRGVAHRTDRFRTSTKAREAGYITLGGENNTYERRRP